MLTNLHPADELSLLREEMRRLEARERELRAGFLSGDLSRTGTIARIDLKVQRRRVLRREALPAAIQEDARYWRTVEHRVVTVEDREVDWAEDDDEDGLVIEPFDA